MELQVLLEVTASPDPEVSRVCLGRREMRGPVVSQVFPVLSDCRVCQDHQVRKEKMETLAQWVHLVLLVQGVLKVLVEQMVLLALLEVSAQWVEMVKRVRPVRQVIQDHQESLVQEDPKVSLERKEKPALLELQDLPVQEDPLEMTVPKETQVLLASLEIQVLLVSLELVDWMAFLETREMMERPVSLVHPVHLVKLVLQDPLESEVLLAQVVQKAGKERRVQRARLVLRDQWAKLDLWAPRGLLESLELRAYVASLDLWVSRDFLELLARTVLLDHWVLLVFLA